jgi:hypothetical protein
MTASGPEDRPVLRIGNASGFYGDRFAAMREMLTGGPLDVLTGDYLAELTMLILGRDRLKDPARGYARTFLRQLEECLGLALDGGVKIVANAGGLNPAGLAEAVAALTDRLGLSVRVGHVTGDDLLPRAAEFGFEGALTANAYLGGWGIAECLTAGADVVVTGRVTDASLVVGPAAAHFGWARDDWNALAGATVAGHVIECGTQATGRNYAYFTEIPELGRPGFPIAELHPDGSAVITKHPGTGGAVTVETVTAQLLYEIAGPAYAGPDVVADFGSVRLSDDGPDRVRVSVAAGSPPPVDLKVCLNRIGGFRNAMTLVLTGLAVEGKAALVRDQFEAALADRGPRELTWTLARTDHPDADTEEAASALLHVVAKDADPARAGRAFSQAAVELALGSYPGFHATSPPGDATPYGVYAAAFVPAEAVSQVAVLPDGTRRAVPPTPGEPAGPPATSGELVPPPGLVELAERAESEAQAMLTDLPTGVLGRTRNLPLGAVIGARSGDKGGTANLGVWARTDLAYRWLRNTLSVEQLRKLLPETAELTIERHELPNLRAVNFVIHDLLGEGVASATRFDPQAKALGEWLRSRHLDIPEVLL